MLKRLIKYLPVSRQKYIEAVKQYAETVKQINIILEGLVEAEANHCQIEMSIIKQLQTNKTQKPAPTPANKNNKDAMYQ